MCGSNEKITIPTDLELEIQECKKQIDMLITSNKVAIMRLEKLLKKLEELEKQ